MEFVEVMKDWRRMCATMSEKDEYTACDRCPLQDFGCPAIYETGEEADWAHVESVVAKWAAEHPELVYPTWKEWLEEQRVVVHFDSVNNKGTKVKWELTNKSNCPIPADMAEKLGIEPKEDT